MLSLQEISDRQEIQGISARYVRAVDVRLFDPTASIEREINS